MRKRLWGNYWGEEKELLTLIRIGEKSLDSPKGKYRIVPDKQWWWVQVDGNIYDPFPKGEWERADSFLKRMEMIE